ncbi:MAG: Holliday junction branch migration protein RuvA [Chloroflexota bacterium]|nr:Holliday junction branch migration protein RuvA [Chloroflexota bacterium]
MIATLEGTLQFKGVDCVIINVGGIGFEAHVPSSSLSQLTAINDKIFLYTFLHVKEDNISLYGFTSNEELTLFKNLISVSGVGPKVALSLLSHLSAEQLAMAIISGNIDLMEQVPSVGKKMANRIAMELKDKLKRGWEESGLPLAQEDSDVVAALTSLGYSLREATQAISSLPDSGDLSLEEKVKMSLQQLAGR